MEKEKQKYINENIISKGYNPEDLSSYITQLKGVNIEDISLESLKELIEEFKNERLVKSIPINIFNTDKKIEEKENIYNILYSNCDYEIITKKQQESKIFEFEKEKKKININISNPKIENSGFFHKYINFTCDISSNELNSNIKRTYNDFIWFKNQLNERYPFILISPLMKNNLFFKLDSQSQIRYLNRFIIGILRKKIIRTSPLTYEFLTLEKKKFDDYSQKLNLTPFTLNNIKSMNGKINCSLNEEKLNKANNLIKLINPTKDLFNKLKYSFENIINDFNIISNHMKDLSNIFNNLLIKSNEINQNENIINTYSNLKNIFNIWSNSYFTQSKFFKEDFSEFFNYMNLEYNELETIYKQYYNFKSDYENYGIKLNYKKEMLFNSKNFSKWEIEPGINEDLNLIKNNKKVCFSIMCYKENQILENQKKIIVIAINLIIQQFEKVKKYQGERIKEYFNNLKERNQIICSDCFNLIKLFSISK